MPRGESIGSEEPVGDDSLCTELCAWWSNLSGPDAVEPDTCIALDGLCTMT